MPMRVARLASLLLLAAGTAQAATPPVGVYSCYEAASRFNAPGCMRTSMGCFGIVIEPRPVVMFGVIDASTYSDFDGEHGHYSYDPAQGVITMTDGARQGWRYHKTADWAFSLIDNKTGQDIYTCPLETGKDPRHGPW